MDEVSFFEEYLINNMDDSAVSVDEAVDMVDRGFSLSTCSYLSLESSKKERLFLQLKIGKHTDVGTANADLLNFFI